MAYRDRAKERREKFGIDDTPEYPKPKLSYNAKGEASSSLATSSVPTPPPPISKSNIGNKMLKAMGWVSLLIIFVLMWIICACFFV